MDVNNVKSQMRKGMLEYCIMLLLHKEPGLCFGYYTETEGSAAHCGGRYALSAAHPFEER